VKADKGTIKSNPWIDFDEANDGPGDAAGSFFLASPNNRHALVISRTQSVHCVVWRPERTNFLETQQTPMALVGREIILR
jgi:hypothetical protein